MRSILQRGGGWVLGQGLLMGLVVVLAVVFRSEARPRWPIATGTLLLLGAAVVGLAGALAMGRNLTPFPEPGKQSRFVQHGVYGLVRHPLYSSVMLWAFGWSLVWHSWPALVAAATLVPFFRAKAGREECRLRRKFPEYTDYERRVRRFVPWP